MASSFRYYRDGQLTFRGWISSLKGIEEGALLASDDPLPALGRGVQNLRRLSRILLERKLRPAPGTASTHKEAAQLQN